MVTKKMSFVGLLCIIIVYVGGIQGKSAKRTMERTRRIIGGHVVSVDHFPYLVSIQYNGRNMADTVSSQRKLGVWMHLCGGALIKQSWVLTAAHCFELDGKPENYRVVFKVQNLISSLQLPSTPIEGFVKHEEYNFTSPGFPNDIALVKIKPGTKRLDVIKLPFARDFTRQEQACFTLGWGDTVGNGLQKDMGMLTATRIQLIRNDKCVEMWANERRARVTSRQICGQPGRHAACDGDSGGPLVCIHNRKVRVSGIVSWGQEGCSDPSRPNVFTNVRSYVPWIQKIVHVLKFVKKRVSHLP